MKKDLSFVWFLIYALYVGFAGLAAVGLLSVPLLLFLLAGNFVLSAKKPLFTAAIDAAAGVVSLVSGHIRSAFVMITLAVLAVCVLAVLRFSLKFSQAAFFFSIVFAAAAIFTLCAAVYSYTGTLSASAVMRYITELLETITEQYGNALKQIYGDGVSNIRAVVSILKSALIYMFTGIMICISGILGIIGSATVLKTAYPKDKLLKTYRVSPIGGALLLISLAVLVFADGASVVYCSNIYLSLMPWFCVGGIKYLGDMFKGKRRLNFVAFLLVAMTAFTIGIAASLSILGAADAFWRVRADEK